MKKVFSIGKYGNVEIQNVMVDCEFNCLEEGVDIIFTETKEPSITIVGDIDLSDITADEVEKLINENI